MNYYSCLIIGEQDKQIIVGWTIELITVLLLIWLMPTNESLAI